MSQEQRSWQVRASRHLAAEEEILRWLVKAGLRLQLPCCRGGSFGAGSSAAPVSTRLAGTSDLCSLRPQSAAVGSRRRAGARPTGLHAHLVL